MNTLIKSKEFMLDDYKFLPIYILITMAMNDG